MVKSSVLVIFGIILIVFSICYVIAAADSSKGVLAGSGTPVLAMDSNDSNGNSSDNGNSNNTNAENEGNKTNDDSNGTDSTINKTRLKEANLTKEQIRERKRKITFSPYQKRNESDCLEGCSCQGAVMRCFSESGKEMYIQAGRSGNNIVITMNKVNVSSEMEVTAEDDSRNKTRLRVKLINGTRALIQIMPDKASETALLRLRMKNCNETDNCTIKLKEVSINKGQKLVYEVNAEKRGKFLGMFKVKKKVMAQVDSKNGEIIREKGPWWGFLASDNGW